VISYAIVHEEFYRVSYAAPFPVYEPVGFNTRGERALASERVWAGVLQEHGIACYECDAHAYEHWLREHYDLSERSGLDAEGRRRFVVYDFELKVNCDCDRFAFGELNGRGGPA